MPDANTIAAWATVITAVGGLVLAVSVLIPTLRAAKRADASAIASAVAVREVHTIVNQQRTDAQRYTAVLVDALRASGVDVPDDQSLTPPP
jgi:hypothetical protein